MCSYRIFSGEPHNLVFAAVRIPFAVTTLAMVNPFSVASFPWSRKEYFAVVHFGSCAVKYIFMRIYCSVYLEHYNASVYGTRTWTIHSIYDFLASATICVHMDLMLCRTKPLFSCDILRSGSKDGVHFLYRFHSSSGNVVYVCKLFLFFENLVFLDYDEIIPPEEWPIRFSSSSRELPF